MKKGERFLINQHLCVPIFEGSFKFSCYNLLPIPLLLLQLLLPQLLQQQLLWYHYYLICHEKINKRAINQILLLEYTSLSPLCILLDRKLFTIRKSTSVQIQGCFCIQLGQYAEDLLGISMSWFYNKRDRALGYYM
jgi:hypothetical protein